MELAYAEKIGVVALGETHPIGARTKTENGDQGASAEQSRDFCGQLQEGPID
jgi:hypothetical protein